MTETETVDELLDRVREFEGRRSNISQDLKALRRKLKGGVGIRSFDDRIARALADADEKTADQLREEKAVARNKVQEYRKALRVLTEKIDKARSEHAEARMPEIKADFEQKRDHFVEKAQELIRLGRALKATMTAYRNLARHSERYKRDVGNVRMPPTDLSYPSGTVGHILNLLYNQS